MRVFTNFTNPTDTVLIVSRGENLVESITHFTSNEGIRSAQVSAIGALKDFELGYYDLGRKEYKRKEFHDQDYELISLMGNVSLKEGKPFVHVHGALGNSNFQVFGGHLFEGEVAVTAEVIIRPVSSVLERTNHPEIGLFLIGSTQNCGHA